MNAKRLKLDESPTSSIPIPASSRSPETDGELLRSLTAPDLPVILKQDSAFRNMGDSEGFSASAPELKLADVLLSSDGNDCVAALVVSSSSGVDLGSAFCSGKRSLVLSGSKMIGDCDDADVVVGDRNTSVRSEAEHPRNEMVEDCTNLALPWEPKPVLSKEITQETPLIEVYVETIVDRKQTSRLVRELNSVCPIPALQHLKRVHGNKVILNLSRGGSAQQCVDELKALGLDVNGFSGSPMRQLVPEIPARTRQQFERCLMYWPCNFHEDKALKRLLQSDFFTEEEKRKQGAYMKMCLEAAERSWQVGGIGTAAVVVDPRKDTVMSVGLDQRNAHPLKHAAMVVIDLVATGQGGGVWDVREGEFVLRNPQSRRNKASSVAEEGPGTESACSSRTSNSALGVSELGKSVDDFRRGGATREDNVEGEGETRTKSLPQSEEEGPYLCTGYDVYLSREPCVMCAMALVHSRANKIFYGFSCSHGALGSRVTLHTIKELNHHFTVFKGNLNDHNIRNPECVRSGS